MTITEAATVRIELLVAKIGAKIDHLYQAQCIARQRAAKEPAQDCASAADQ